MLDAAAIAISCIISLIWIDDLWNFGYRGGDWLGRKILNFLRSEV